MTREEIVGAAWLGGLVLAVLLVLGVVTTAIVMLAT